MFLANRLPMVLGWELEIIAQRATSGPQVVAFVQSTAKFADSTKRFADATKETADAVGRTADAIVKIPDDLATERKAAIE